MIVVNKIFRLILILAAILSSFIFGSYLNEIQFLQFYKVLNVIKSFNYRPPGQHSSGITQNELGRLTSFPNKIQVECPKQDNKTIVLLAVGQSNSTNSQGQKHKSTHGSKVINFWDGKCYEAASPLLGATNISGEMWTLLGNELIESNITTQVILIPLGISGSASTRWSSSGDLSKDVIHNLHNMIYSVTHIIFIQGESDFLLKTSYSSYYNNILSFIKTLRQNNINAPIWISITSKCGYGKWFPDNAIANAQNDLSKTNPGVYKGPPTDATLTDLDRVDGCHFSRPGQSKFTHEAIETIFSKQ